MEDPQADDHIVRDISPERGLRRWAFLHPELKFQLSKVDNIHFFTDFTVPQVTFKDTGPVTVTYSVNGTELGSIRCDHAGDYHVEKPLPPGLVKPGYLVKVTYSAEPRWIAPTDRAQLSFLLMGAGFTE
jgi:hypothetical protein